MHRCAFEDRIVLEQGLVTRIVRAEFFDESVDVLKENENGSLLCRNLNFVPMGGYFVDLPNDLCLESDGNVRKVGTGRWSRPLINVSSDALGESLPLSDEERILILEKHPGFRFVLKKWSGGKARTMMALRMWKRHPEVEFPLALGYWKVAMCESFYTASNRKEIVRYLLKERPPEHITFSEIRLRLKYGIYDGEWESYSRFRTMCGRNVGYPTFKYLEKMGMADNAGYRLYKDYLDMLGRAGHDGKDKYWKCPKDLREMHDRLVAEIERVRRMEELARIAEASARKKSEFDRYLRAVKPWLGRFAEVDGYSIFVSDSAEEWLEQAESLNQCIVSCGYMGRVADGKCVIVFVRKNGVPVATAEVLKGNRIGQFYADEHDRDNCLPSEEVRTALEKWLNSLGNERAA